MSIFSDALKGPFLRFVTSLSRPFPHLLTDKRYPKDVESSRSGNAEPVSTVLDAPDIKDLSTLFTPLSKI